MIIYVEKENTIGCAEQEDPRAEQFTTMIQFEHKLFLKKIILPQKNPKKTKTKIRWIFRLKFQWNILNLNTLRPQNHWESRNKLCYIKVPDQRRGFLAGPSNSSRTLPNPEFPGPMPLGPAGPP